MPSQLQIMTALLQIIGVYGYPNDAYYHTEQEGYLGAIMMDSAWSQAPGRVRTTIAVIDAGMMSDHPDLKGNYVPGYNVADQNMDTSDKSGHGTIIAGAAGAVVNNGKGIAGVANYVSLMPISIQSATRKRNDKDYTSGILYAVKEKVDVILLATGWKEVSNHVPIAIARAKEANIPVVCASGNSGKNISLEENRVFPCEYTKSFDNVICVAGTDGDQMNLLAESNYAPFLDVAAPATVFTTLYDGGYGWRSGTSVSAALVAGAIALFKGVTTRSLSAKDIKSIIQQSSTAGVKSHDGRTTLTFGRLNAYEAVRQAMR